MCRKTIIDLKPVEGMLHSSGKYFVEILCASKRQPVSFLQAWLRSWTWGHGKTNPTSSQNGSQILQLLLVSPMWWPLLSVQCYRIHDCVLDHCLQVFTQLQNQQNISVCWSCACHIRYLNCINRNLQIFR